MFLNRVPMGKDTPSPVLLVYLFIYSLIHVCLPESPKRSLPVYGQNIRSPSTEPHVDRRPTYNGIRPGSPRGSFMTLQSLPQCHAAIPPTLAWVDHSPIRQRVSQQPPSGYTLHNCYHLARDPGYSRVQIYDTPRYGRGVGFMEGTHTHTHTHKIKITL